MDVLADAEHLKQDMEVRHEATIKAANYHLNEGSRHSNIGLKKPLENPLAHTEELASTSQRSLNASDKLVESAQETCYPSTFNKSK